MNQPSGYYGLLQPPDIRMAAFLASGAGEDGNLKVDSYTAAMLPIDGSKRDLLHELTVSVFWPHRSHDIDLFLSLGQGYIALDEIGRPLSSAMYYPMGADFAMFGMMVTPPRLQSQGAGRWLLRQIMRDCLGRDLRLSATRSGYRLYESAGFTPVATIRQQQGIARRIYRPDPVRGIELHDLTAADDAAIKALDAHAFGADRGTLLDMLQAQATGVMATRAGRPCGFAMMRVFGKGHVIGPVVAESDAMAMQLVAPLIQQAEGSFLRLDTPVDSELFTAFLSAAGMGMFDTVTEMRIGPHRRATVGAVTYGLAAHSLG